MICAQQRADSGVALPSAVYGPSLPSPRLIEPVEVPWSQFERSVHDLHRFIVRNHQIPNAVLLGSKPVPPEAFIVAIAKIASTGVDGSAPPEKVTIAPCAARHRKVRRSGLTGDLVVADLPAGIPFRTSRGTGAAAGVDPQTRETQRVACPLRKICVGCRP